MKLINIFIVILLFFITGCSSFSKTIGLKKEAPDEFKVISNAPLSLPPDFSLRPPSSKELKLQESKQPKNDEPDVTIGEGTFLEKAGTNDANTNIKNILDSEGAEVKEEKKKGFFSRVFGKDKTNATDPIVNATQEKSRIADNKQSGKEITGEETPVVEEKKGILNKIFGK